MVVAIRYSPVDRFSRRRLRATPSGGGKVDITRFKGLGETQSVHLRETAMDPTKRILLQVDVPTAADVDTRREAMRTTSLVGPDAPQAGKALRLHPGECPFCAISTSKGAYGWLTKCARQCDVKRP